MKIPTGDQCSANEKIGETDVLVKYACWYPQMGGYVGRAIAIFDKRGGGCIDVYVWHDGEFPFHGESPVRLHHCDPQQFIDFGKWMKKINRQWRTV